MNLTLDNDDIDNTELIEKEIDNILDNINYTEYLTLTEIESKNEEIIDHTLNRFSHYDTNMGKRDMFLKELKGYQYINADKIKKGNIIKYLDLRIFYDIAMLNGYVAAATKKAIIIFDNIYTRRLKKNHNVFFKKITNEDLVKIKLIELIK
jgi:hypothetical protein